MVRKLVLVLMLFIPLSLLGQDEIEPDTTARFESLVGTNMVFDDWEFDDGFQSQTMWYYWDNSYGLGGDICTPSRFSIQRYGRVLSIGSSGNIARINIVQSRRYLWLEDRPITSDSIFYHFIVPDSVNAYCCGSIN